MGAWVLTSVLGIGYVTVFLVTGVICLVAIKRALDIDDSAVRNGLVGLLATTGAWALLKVAFFVLPDPFREAAYTAGLVIGFATVWAWLYFCSAYTGRNYHRNRAFRRIGTGVFLGVVAVKLTNPIHGRYFTATEVTTPFVHLAIDHGLFHWTATGLSYALAAMGLFMLLEHYTESTYDTRSLAGLTVLLALPIGVDVLALVTPRLVNVIYAPLGVAAFVLGVLYVYERRFMAVQTTGRDDDAVVFVDDQGIVRDYSDAARSTFPDLDGAVGDRLAEVLPDVAAVAESDDRILERTVAGEHRYYLVSNSTATLGDAQARMLTFADVTEVERRRRELRRHNEQLEGFAGALAHELRNMVQIIDGRLGIVSERMATGTPEHESVEAAAEANDRLSELVEDFTALTRYGQTVDRLATVEFGTVARTAWQAAEAGDLDLVVEQDGTLEADSQRLQELLRNAFEFAQLNGAETVRVALEDGAFTVIDDGRPPEGGIDGYFEFGESVPDAESGMKLPSVRTFARVQGWTATIDTDYREGTRIVLSDVETTVFDGTADDPSG